MASLTSQLTQLFGDAFAALGLDPEHGVVVISQRPELAQFQCNGALGAAKSAGKNPRELAQDVIDIVSKNEALEEIGTLREKVATLEVELQVVDYQVRQLFLPGVLK